MIDKIIRRVRRWAKRTTEFVAPWASIIGGTLHLLAVILQHVGVPGS